MYNNYIHLRTDTINMKVLAVTLLCSVIALGAANLQDKYSFSAVLLDDGEQYYELHWNYVSSTESIYFAVNVSTTGWVGFGLSPTGQMTGSDVVIGWVSDGGNSYFHDRYAEGQFLPPIDASQDWFLVNSIEENGFTILEFSRNFTTCDTRDLDITISTARVVWSFSQSDPTDPSGAGAMQHDSRGTRSINLIGGLEGNTTPASEDFLDIVVSDVAIPSASTTYWCSTTRLPTEVIETTHYINRISPVLTHHDRDYVHHLLVYLCSAPLTVEDASGVCFTLNNEIRSCRGGLLVGGWAVGGEDFVYPEGIAYPVGGIGQEHFVVIEVHYDNPNNVEGVMDNSGLRFFYTTEIPEQNAGIMFLGHNVDPIMVIPPRTERYTVSAICTTECTSEFIPEDGIRIFGNVLHTHIVGRALTIQHFRMNSECGVLEELEPIDQNLNYDFNFQQFTHLSKEHVVLPGDILVLQCEYDTTENDEVVIGGESTIEEMCLSFPTFYPRPPDGSTLIQCVSYPTRSSFTDFITYLSTVNPEAAQQLIDQPEDGLTVLNGLDWEGNPQLAVSLQNSILNSTIFGGCASENGENRFDAVKIPTPDCSYQAPDRCSDTEILGCCERLSGATQMEISVGVGFFMLILSMLFLYK